MFAYLHEQVHIENKQPALAAALCLELGNALRSLGKSGEAIQHYQRAAELQFQNALDCLVSLGHVASCKIDTKDFEGSLQVLTEMSFMVLERGCCLANGKLIGSFSDIQARCEITRVLLLMILQVFNFFS